MDFSLLRLNVKVSKKHETKEPHECLSKVGLENPHKRAFAVLITINLKAVKSKEYFYLYKIGSGALENSRRAIWGAKARIVRENRLCVTLGSSILSLQNIMSYDLIRTVNFTT